MVALVSEYVALQPRGPDDQWGRCPFHEERSASFHVRPSKGLYKCFGCGRGGDVFRFVEEIERVPFPEAVRRLATRAGVTLEAATPEEQARSARLGRLRRGTDVACAFFEEVRASSTPVGARARAYLAERGVTEETARAFRLGMAPPEGNALVLAARARGVAFEVLQELGLATVRDGRGVDFFRDRLMFPIADEQGNVVAFGGRTLCNDPRKYMNSREVSGLYEKRRVLYGLDRARNVGGTLRRLKRLVVVEGYLDVVVPHQAGKTEVVAALGTALTPEQARLARRYVDEVVILFDGDAAGSAAALRALAGLVGEPDVTVRVARLPEGMDPDDLVRRDPAAFDRAIAGAENLVGFLVGETLRGMSAGSPAARERAIRAAVKLLARIPDAGIRLFTEMKDVADRFQLPEDVLRGETCKARDEAAKAARLRRPERPHDARGGPVSTPAGKIEEDDLELCLLEALLAVPDAPGRLAAQGLGPEAFSPGAARSVASAVFAYAREVGRVEATAVLGRTDDPAARDLLGRLVGRLTAGVDRGKDYEGDLQGAGRLVQRTRQRRLGEIRQEFMSAKDPARQARLLEETKALLAQLGQSQVGQAGGGSRDGEPTPGSKG